MDSLMDAVKQRLARAEARHPRFAEGTWHALGILSEEHGEAVREATKHAPGWEARMDSELIDLIVVALRMLRRDHIHPEAAELEPREVHHG